MISQNLPCSNSPTLKISPAPNLSFHPYTVILREARTKNLPRPTHFPQNTCPQPVILREARIVYPDLLGKDLVSPKLFPMLSFWGKYDRRISLDQRSRPTRFFGTLPIVNNLTTPMIVPQEWHLCFHVILPSRNVILEGGTNSLPRLVGEGSCKTNALVPMLSFWGACDEESSNPNTRL